MPRKRDEEKIQQVMKFLMSFRKPAVQVLMNLRGFEEHDRQEGFEKVDRAAGRHLSMDDIAHAITGPDKSLITAIDAFENIWFDVVDAALARLFPKVHAKVLKNLKKTSGVMVVINVKTLLERIAALESSADADEQAAFAEIERRELDKDKRDYAQGLVDQAYAALPKPADEEPTGPTEEEEQQLQAAIDDMWAWYLDWSKTARTVIKDKRLRIIMGISSANRRAGDPDEDEGDEDTGGPTGGGGTQE